MSYRLCHTLARRSVPVSRHAHVIQRRREGMRELVKIFDTTLRDGEQSPGATMNIAEKVRIAEQLEKLNVDIIEAGFPISSEGDFEAVKAISKTIKRSEVAALAGLI